MSGDVFGPWIEHDGKGCPVAGLFIRAAFEDGDVWMGIPSASGQHRSFNWTPGYVRITRYQIRKPRGLTILEGLLEDLPAPTDQVPA